MAIANITRKQLLDLLRPGINELFEKAYTEFDPQTYIKEVDFGQDIQDAKLQHRLHDNIGND